MTRPLDRQSRQRGVSLIEALVALAVMAFGMLGLVGVQATLRLNSDVSKQRSEAVRIAQAAVEDWRAYTLMAATPGVADYTDIVSVGPTAEAGVNATYQVTRTVTSSTPPAPSLKTVVVDVAWTDRANEPQSVRLSSSLAGVAPELAGSLTVPAAGSPTSMPRGRSPIIPLDAKLFPDGSSGFRPPQPAGGTVAWLFNNTTGLVTVCESPVTGTALLTRANMTTCGTGTAQLLSGNVRFAYNAPPTSAIAQSPTDTALNLDMAVTLTSTGHPTPSHVCFDDAPVSATPPITATTVRYYCLIYPNEALSWSGISTVVPRGLDAAPAWTIAASGAGNYKVCRYTPSGLATPTNTQHPREYSGVTAAQVMTNQNFLVISAADTCPVDSPPDPANGDFVDSNTVQHQPAP